MTTKDQAVQAERDLASSEIPKDPDAAPEGRFSVFEERVITLLAGTLTAIAVAWALDLRTYLGLVVFREQMMAAIVALTFPIVFLRYPLRRNTKRSGVPWYDWVLSIVGFAAGLYLTVRYPVLMLEFHYLPTETFLIGIVVMACLLEALRRVYGYPLLIIIVGFILYALFANLVPGQLKGRPQDFDSLVSFLAIDTQGVFGLPLYITATMVLVFLLFGQLLMHTGGSSFFTDLAMGMMGRFRGGPAKVAVLASAFFGTVSGNTASNVLTTGVVTIPTMRKAGYTGAQAGAIEVAASTGGQLMPPVMGAAAFLMAQFLQVPYQEVVIAALLPSVLYFLAVLIQVDLLAARDGIEGLPREQIPRIRTVLARGWYMVLPFALLIYVLFVMNRQAEMAALVATAALLVLGSLFAYGEKKLRLADVWTAVQETGRMGADLIVVVAMAGCVIGVLQVTGLGFGLTFTLVQFGEGNMFLLLVLTAVICIILGMGMPTTAIYFLLATLVAPPLVELGAEKMGAHLFVLYFGMLSMMTPPVAFACFVAAALAKADYWETAFTSMRVGWLAFVVPFLFIYSPSLIMIGDPAAIAMATVTAGFGVWFIAAALIGFFLNHLSIGLRILFGIAGMAMLTPASLFPGGVYVDLAGLAAGAALGAYDWSRSRRARKATA